MPERTIDQQVKAALARLKRAGSARVREEMATRYGIRTAKAFGVPVGRIQALGRALGHDHALAAALWKTGWYEARMLAVFVDEPERVTPVQMDRWCRDFDNWGICDTACFHLFDRVPGAFGKVAAWSRRRGEFERRAAFALLASLALHDRASGDAPFAKCLPLIGRAASDERNFVKKAVSWALRGMAGRSPALHAACTTLATRLAGSDDATERWVGRDVLRDISRPLVVRRAKARGRAAG